MKNIKPWVKNTVTTPNFGATCLIDAKASAWYSLTLILLHFAYILYFLQFESFVNTCIVNRPALSKSIDAVFPTDSDDGQHF